MDRYTGFAPCLACDGYGEWDEGPLAASSGATEPDYRQVVCPECNGRGAIWHAMEHPRTLDDLENEALCDADNGDGRAPMSAPFSAAFSEIEPDDGQDQGSCCPDRQGSKGREVGGRAALLPSRLQCGERDVCGEVGGTDESGLTVEEMDEGAAAWFASICALVGIDHASPNRIVTGSEGGGV